MYFTAPAVTINGYLVWRGYGDVAIDGEEFPGENDTPWCSCNLTGDPMPWGGQTESLMLKAEAEVDALYGWAL